MKASTLSALDSWYAHPAASTATRTPGKTYMNEEYRREVALLDHFQKADNGDHDKNGRVGEVDLHYPGHSMAVPVRHQAAFTANHVVRQEGLFITSMDTHGPATFQTYSDVTLHDNGMTKRSATERADGVQVRTVVVDATDASKSYVEEYFIAR